MKKDNHTIYFKFGDYILYPNEYLKNAGRIVSLPPKELKILSCLVDRAGQVISKDELFQYAWGFSAVSDESLTRCIYTLRQQLGDSSRKKCIVTVYGHGYYFNYPVERCVTEEHIIPREAVNGNNYIRVTDVYGDESNEIIIKDIYRSIGMFSSKLHRETKDIDIKNLTENYLSLSVIDDSGYSPEIIKRIHVLANEILLTDPLNVDALAILGVVSSFIGGQDNGDLYFRQARKLSPDNINIDYYQACRYYLIKDYSTSYNILQSRKALLSDSPKLNWLMVLVKDKVAKTVAVNKFSVPPMIDSNTNQPTADNQGFENRYYR